MNRALLLALILSLSCATKHAPITTPMVCTCVLGHPELWDSGTLDAPEDCAVHGPTFDDPDVESEEMAAEK